MRTCLNLRFPAAFNHVPKRASATLEKSQDIGLPFCGENNPRSGKGTWHWIQEYHIFVNTGMPTRERERERERYRQSCAAPRSVSCLALNPPDFAAVCCEVREDRFAQTHIFHEAFKALRWNNRVEPAVAQRREFVQTVCSSSGKILNERGGPPVEAAFCGHIQLNVQCVWVLSQWERSEKAAPRGLSFSRNADCMRREYGGKLGNGHGLASCRGTRVRQSGLFGERTFAPACLGPEQFEAFVAFETCDMLATFVKRSKRLNRLKSFDTFETIELFDNVQSVRRV